MSLLNKLFTQLSFVYFMANRKVVKFIDKKMENII